MNNTNKAILAALTDLSGIGDARAYDLYTYFDKPSELMDPSNSILDEFYYLDDDAFEELQSIDEIVESYRRQFEKYEDEGISVLGIEDNRYPTSVQDGPAPVLLYAKGNLNLINGATIGVSGSRETNEVGQQWIRSLSAEIVEKGYTVVSGGAQGADTAAHEGALKSTESTIAVLGTGVNVAYPPENEPLFERIVDMDGLLLSMRPPEAEPNRHSFLDRNELIAALSDGMIFVATDGSGGTMAQYKMAVDQNRQVFVPPIDLEIMPNEGINDIRETGYTSVIQTASDISDLSPSNGTDQMSLDDWT